MKKFILSLLLTIFSLGLMAQTDSTALKDKTLYRIIKTDGGELVGKILKEDEREIYFLTEDQRRIYIPQHVIKELIPLDSKSFREHNASVGEDRFATRYFFTTNGLPIKKGEHYVQWNLYGPDFQFGLGNNFGVGIITSWFGTPVVANLKKTWQLEENVHFGLGALVGTLSWVNIESGGALPFASITFGDRSQNLSFSGGYGSVWGNNYRGGGALASVGGMTKLSQKFSLVFDSFIVVANNGGSSGALVIPGIRWHQSEGKAFQFCFLAYIGEGEAAAIPIPMVQWYRNL